MIARIESHPESDVADLIQETVEMKARLPNSSAWSGTEIDFWTPCDMLYQRKMPTMF